MVFRHPVPELPVRNVAEAQAYYRDRLGFDVAWHNTDGRIGAVAQGSCAIFLRETDGDIVPCTHWVFAEKLDEAFAALEARGAEIVAPPEDKPWGLRQFTVQDLHGHLYHFHCD